MPSEAEWEYAARAGTGREYGLPAPDGSDDIKGKALANCVGCGSKWDMQTAPVGSFKANAWDLYDMHGNVTEWVEDCWHENYQHAPQDGSAWHEETGGDCSLRVVRGGGWNDDVDGVRSAVRLGVFPEFATDGLGFRVVCSSPIVDH